MLHSAAEHLHCNTTCFRAEKCRRKQLCNVHLSKDGIDYLYPDGWAERTFFLLKKHTDLHTHVTDTLLLSSALPPAELAEKLRKRPEVQSVALEGKEKLRIILHPGTAPANFVAGLITEGVPVTGFEIARRHLEDIFLDATKGEVQ